MGYFSNGTEGRIYEEVYCIKCIHYGTENKGCPIWGLHLFYNYDQYKDKKISHLLNSLIPRSKNGQNNKCNLFIKYKDTK